MAKPKHGRWYNYPTPSHPTFPSQTVLSLLALIATSPPVVAGSPLPPPTPPPDFLCPFIRRDVVYPSPSSSTSAATPTPSTHVPGRQAIADRYVKDSDSLWRKANSWILYGSTCCSSSATASASTTSHTPTPTSASTSTTAVFDTSALPAGWNNANSTTSSTESTTILALAIVLAGSICVFILGCLVWRRRKKKAKDIERKLGRKHDTPSGNVLEQDARGKMRMWVRASARWKSNVRQSARRRRKKFLVAATDRPPSPTPTNSQALVNTPSPSRRSSFSGGAPEPPNVLGPDDNSTDQFDAQHDLPRPLSPPTYGASFTSRFTSVGPSSAFPPDHPHFAPPSHSPSFIDDEPLPYTSRSDGHVAVDDKTHLARIRDLASSPPAVLGAASQNTMQSVSAPEWHQVEEDPEGLGVDLSDMTSRDFGFHPSFPPPPKADISFGRLDHRPLCYGKADDTLVSPGPSGSLFGASLSVPPIDYPSLEPSAPSLDEDDLFQDWEAASSYIPEVSTPADQSSTPACAAESPTSPAASLTPRTSFLPIQELSTRTSILPRYHP